MRSIILILCLVVFLAGCEKKRTEPEAAKEEVPPTIELLNEAPTSHLLGETVEPVLLETPSAALATWRKFGKIKPVLVLMSNDPFLAPLPETLEKDVLDLVWTAPDDRFLAATDATRPDLFLFPAMSVETALKAGIFSQFIWILPTSGTIEEISAETLRTQLIEMGAIDEKEGASLEKSDHGVRGFVRGVPFQAVIPFALPPLEAPIYLHLDLSYFSPLYKGEIKTPLFPLVFQTLDKLRQAKWQSFGVTISRSNRPGPLPLKTRFLGPTIAEIFRTPSLFEAQLPINWHRRGNALYLENFFQNEKIHELYLDMEKDLPDDPSVKFDLYNISRSLKKGDKALEYLAQAVALDRTYALEYLNLGDVALEKGLPAKKTEMLEKACAAFPEDPFLKLQLADILLASGNREKALEMIDQLQKINWSPVYYSQIPDLLRQIMESPEAAKKD